MGGRESHGTRRHAHRAGGSQPQRARIVRGRAKARGAMAADRARSQRAIAAPARARSRRSDAAAAGLAGPLHASLLAGRTAGRQPAVAGFPSSRATPPRSRSAPKAAGSTRNARSSPKLDGSPHRWGLRSCALKPRCARLSLCCRRCGSPRSAKPHPATIE